MLGISSLLCSKHLVLPYLPFRVGRCPVLRPLCQTQCTTPIWPKAENFLEALTNFIIEIHYALTEYNIFQKYLTKISVLILIVATHLAR